MIPPRKGQIARGLIPHSRPRGLLQTLRLRELRWKLRSAASFARRLLFPSIQARLSLARLDLRLGAAEAFGPKRPVAVAVHYGDCAMADAFIRHHVGIGIGAFVFLDLSVGGDLATHLAGRQDCSVWRPKVAIACRDVTLWLNGLRGRYASGRWCLSLDTADAFVFYRCETRSITDLTDFLESESRDHLAALVIEMYGETPGAGPLATAPAAPLTTLLPYFDPFGFAAAEPGRFRDISIRGGVQRRVLYGGQPRQSPPLNRIPLVKWTWSYRYVAETRLIMPMHLNIPHTPWHSSPTGCILRFALAQDRPTLENAVRWSGHATEPDAGAGAYAGLLAMLGRPLKQDVSRRYTGSHDLVDCGLLNPGQWF